MCGVGLEPNVERYQIGVVIYQVTRFGSQAVFYHIIEKTNDYVSLCWVSSQNRFIELILTQKIYFNLEQQDFVTTFANKISVFPLHFSSHNFVGTCCFRIKHQMKRTKQMKRRSVWLKFDRKDDSGCRRCRTLDYNKFCKGDIISKKERKISNTMFKCLYYFFDV